jgi:hypothetical protein
VWDLPTEGTVSTLSGHTDYVRVGCLAAASPELNE